MAFALGREIVQCLTRLNAMLRTDKRVRKVIEVLQQTRGPDFVLTEMIHSVRVVLRLIVISLPSDSGSACQWVRSRKSE